MIKRILAVAAAVVMLTACGASKPGSPSGGGSTGSSSATSKGPVTVTVKNFAFNPGSLTIAKGTKVTWKFDDNVQHNVTSDDNKFHSKDIEHGTYAYTFNTPGTYKYICSIHQYMKGTVTVK